MSVDIAIQYAEDVLSDRIAVCQQVKLAAARFINDLAVPDSPWEFRRDLAGRVMRWCGLLPNIKGPLAGQSLKLMPVAGIRGGEPVWLRRTRHDDPCRHQSSQRLLAAAR